FQERASVRVASSDLLDLPADVHVSHARRSFVVTNADRISVSEPAMFSRAPAADVAVVQERARVAGTGSNLLDRPADIHVSGVRRSALWLCPDSLRVSVSERGTGPPTANVAVLQERAGVASSSSDLLDSSTDVYVSDIRGSVRRSDTKLGSITEPR